MSQHKRVLMLGWEFPPMISGGLGRVCHALVRELSRAGDQVTFVLPKPAGGELAEDDDIIVSAQPQSPDSTHGARHGKAVASTYQLNLEGSARVEQPGFANVILKAVPAQLPSPYGTGAVYGLSGRSDQIGFLGGKFVPESAQPSLTHFRRVMVDGPRFVPHESLHYGGDLLMATRRYAALCMDLAHDLKFDVIHAHDWLTFPAALALSAAFNKPFIAHVHSLEANRAGIAGNPIIHRMERRGMLAAQRVITVSRFMRDLIVDFHGITPGHIEVVYNGIDAEIVPASPEVHLGADEKVVLFFGRVTHQKGPAYFVEAAKRVLQHRQDVRFVVAGSGDQIGWMIEAFAQAGIGQHVTFTGFLRGDDVQKVLSRTDVMVMPSVSEPFGLAPLEAIAADVPVIVSRTAGVSEVVNHMLKVDYWDAEQIADRILAVLRDPVLSSSIRDSARMEIRKLTWEGMASRVRQVYQQITEPNLATA